MPDGSDIVCTITNMRKTGSLQIVKDVVPNDPATNWNFAVSGPTDYTCSVAGDGACTAQTVATGSYSIVETEGTGTNLDDYTTTWACTVNGGTGPSGTGTTISGLTVNKNDVVVCAFTNSRQLGSLEVTKVVDWNGVTPDTSQTFRICISGPSYSTPDCSTVDYDGGKATWINLLPGDYTVTETDPGTLWGVSGSPATVTVSPNDTGSTTITNTRLKSTITACKKDTDGTYLSGWTINLSGPETGSGVTSDGTTGTLGCVDFVVAQPGEYTLSEVKQDNWTLISPASNQHAVAVTIGMDYGRFEFENFEWATVKVCKVDTDGTYLAGWDITLDGVTQTTGDDGCTTFTVKDPGDYTVSEVLKDGWTNISPLSYPVTVKTGGSYEFEFENLVGDGDRLQDGL